MTMKSEHFFTNLNSLDIASFIGAAEGPVCLAAPGIQKAVAEALSLAAEKLGPELISVCLDFDERVLRMGYGEFESINIIRAAGIKLEHSPGLRSGLVIVGDKGYVYTPTALYLEAEPSDVEVRNAIKLSKQQVTEALSRMSPVAKAIAIMRTNDPEEQKRINNLPTEVETQEITDHKIIQVTQRLEQAPPVKFDVARQVRVFESFLQYVEMTLSGAAIQRHKLKIPKPLQDLGAGDDLEGRLKTTFDLIEKGSSISSKTLDKKLKEIRETLTPSLGNKHGRVVLKSVKPMLEENIAELQKMIEEHQKEINEGLAEQLDSSKEAIVEYYLPLVVSNPPKALFGHSITGKATEVGAKKWIQELLDKVFPTPESLLNDIKLEVSYKDITYETLNEEGFVECVKEAFKYSDIDWDKAHKEFMAAGQEEDLKN